MNGTIRRNTLEMDTRDVFEGTEIARAAHLEGPRELPTDSFAEAVDRFIDQARGQARRRTYGATWTKTAPLTGIPLEDPMCTEAHRTDEV